VACGDERLEGMAANHAGSRSRNTLMITTLNPKGRILWLLRLSVRSAVTSPYPALHVTSTSAAMRRFPSAMAGWASLWHGVGSW
jgi:hypothetical protein